MKKKPLKAQHADNALRRPGLDFLAQHETLNKKRMPWPILTSPAER